MPRQDAPGVDGLGHLELFAFSQFRGAARATAVNHHQGVAAGCFQHLRHVACEGPAADQDNALRPLVSDRVHCAANHRGYCLADAATSENGDPGVLIRHGLLLVCDGYLLVSACYRDGSSCHERTPRSPIRAGSSTGRAARWSARTSTTWRGRQRRAGCYRPGDGPERARPEGRCACGRQGTPDTLPSRTHPT